MLQPTKISKKEQAKHLLFNFMGKAYAKSSHLPFMFLTLNMIGYALFAHLLSELEINENYNHPNWINYIDATLKQLCDLGFFGLIILLLINFEWKKSTWAAYFMLCYIWLVNTIYQYFLPFNFETKDFVLYGNYISVIIILPIPFYIILSIIWLKNKN